MKGLYPLAVGVFGFFLILQSVHGDELDPRGLRSDNTEIRWNTVGQIVTQRRAIVEETLEILKESRGATEISGSCRAALRVLGALRAPEAVPELSKMVDARLEETEADCFSISGPTIGDRYPAAGVLAKIGKPAVAECLTRLGDFDPRRNESRERYCWVIGEVEGPTVGRFVIEDRIRTETNPLRKKQLQAAHALFEKLFPVVDEETNKK